jgi:hypothetical protein
MNGFVVWTCITIPFWSLLTGVYNIDIETGGSMMPKLALVGASHIHTPGFVKKLKERPDIQVSYVWDRIPAVAERQAAN